MNVKHELEAAVGPADGIYLNEVDIDPLTIKAVIIHEVVPPDPSDGFYGQASADYMKNPSLYSRERGLQPLPSMRSFVWESI